MKKRSIKNKLIFYIVGLILLFGTGAVVTIFFHSQKVFIDTKQEDLKAIVFSQTEELRRVLNNSKILTKNVSEQTWLIDYLDNEPQEQNETILTNLKMLNLDDAYSAIYIMDYEGNTLVSTDESFVGNNYSFRPYFQEALYRGDWVDVALGVTSKKLGYYFSNSILDQNKNILGVVVFKLKPEFVHAAFHLLEVKEDLHIFMADSSGVIIYSDENDRLYKSLGEMNLSQKKETIDGQRFSGLDIQSLSYNILQENLFYSREVRIYEFYNPQDKEEEILSIASVGGYPFFIVTEEDASKYNDLAYSISLTLSLFVALSALTTILLILFIINIFFKPLDDLEEGVRKIDQGDLDYRISISDKNDFSVLAKSFNSLATNLKKEKENINKKIQERTKELEKINKYMIGRELKMVKLKKENKDLKNKK